VRRKIFARGLGAGLSAFLVIAFLGSNNVMGQGTTYLTGQVINGTSNSDLPVGIEVIFQWIGQDGIAREEEAVTDSQGIFHFPLPQQDTVEQAILQTTYQGATYNIKSQGAGFANPVTLMIYESTSLLTELIVNDHTMVVTGIEPERQQLAILEAVQFINSGEKTIVSSPSSIDPMNLIRFALPPTASGLEVESSSHGGHLLRVDKGFALITPIQPGKYEVIFSYWIPYADGEWVHDHSLPLGANAFRFVIPEGMATVQAKELNDIDVERIGSKSYTVFKGGSFNIGDRINVTVFNLPELPVWSQALQASKDEGFWKPFFLLSTGGLMCFLLGLSVVRARKGGAFRRNLDQEQWNQSYDEKQRLVQAIVELDQAFSSGDLKEPEYTRLRHTLKNELINID